MSLKVVDLVIMKADSGIVKFNVSNDEARPLKLLEYLVQQAALNEHSLDDLSVKLLHHMGAIYHAKTCCWMRSSYASCSQSYIGFGPAE